MGIGFSNNFQVKILLVALACFLSIPPSICQSFYKEKEPKTAFYRIGLGVGTLFAAPRPNYEKIENDIVPVISLGFGRKYGNHFSLISTLSFQPFSSDELKTQDGTTIEVSEPIFQGYNYALDLTPTINLVPSYHHMSRPKLNVSLGLGIGYLLSYRTEVFNFNEKAYDFSFFKSSLYFPVRSNLSLRIGSITNLDLEFAFFYTFLDNSPRRQEFEMFGDHFGQVSLNLKRYFKNK